MFTFENDLHRRIQAEVKETVMNWLNKLEADLSDRQASEMSEQMPGSQRETCKEHVDSSTDIPADLQRTSKSGLTAERRDIYTNHTVRP
jgi:hypothetical protein